MEEKRACQAGYANVRKRKIVGDEKGRINPQNHM